MSFKPVLGGILTKTIIYETDHNLFCIIKEFGSYLYNEFEINVKGLYQKNLQRVNMITLNMFT